MASLKTTLECFDLMSSDHFHVILHPDKKHGLIFNRMDGSVSAINYEDAKELANLKLIGQFYGIVGKYLGKYLVLIKSKTFIGSIFDPVLKKDHDIYVINQIHVIDILCVPNPESSRASAVLYDVGSDRLQQTDSCTRGIEGEISHPNNQNNFPEFTSLPITISSSSYASLQSRSTPWNPFKLANSLRPRIPTQLLRSSFADQSINVHGAGLTSGNVQHEDSDKRLVDEMTKLFTNTNSFYFSPTLDLTNRMSKLTSSSTVNRRDIWKTADDRFFWNKHMLKDLIEMSENCSDINHFICVILQGFIAIQKRVKIPHLQTDPMMDSCAPATSINAYEITESLDIRERVNEYDPIGAYSDEYSKIYQLTLISRRSVYHAGTRYRRRGCDDKGNCANFVETEQIFRYNKHFTSMVILRGSIPLYWYQTGYNYRPPPIIHRSNEENQEVFRKHFQSLFDYYGTEEIIAVDCTEQNGREKELHEAYKSNIEKLQKEKSRVKLIEFDFHKHCRGRRCNDSQVERHLKSCGLTDQLLKGIKYYWNDGEIIWNQVGVFRVNCLDCSDRTNVVQRAISLQILDLQLARLGLINPDTNPEDNDIRRLMQIMWATNGNVLSTQYCGTRALFGTVDRKLASYLQDTYSSASRYYMSKFRDAYRQAAIDAMLGTGDVSRSIKSAQDEPGDNYELINIEPDQSNRGGAFLKHVGNRVTSKLARISEKLQNKPRIDDSTVEASVNPEDFDDPDLIAAKLDDDILSDLNIDWPSSESVDNEQNTRSNNYVDMSKEEDNFQDDEFGHLMLSIDLADLQKLRQGSVVVEDSKEMKKPTSGQNREEINMTETYPIRADQKAIYKQKTTTTTT